MARSHSHNVKIGEGQKARRRKRKQRKLFLSSFEHAEQLGLPEVLVAWVCTDPSCIKPHGPAGAVDPSLAATS